MQACVLVTDSLTESMGKSTNMFQAICWSRSANIIEKQTTQFQHAPSMSTYSSVSRCADLKGSVLWTLTHYQSPSPSVKQISNRENINKPKTQTNTKQASLSLRFAPLLSHPPPKSDASGEWREWCYSTLHCVLLYYMMLSVDDRVMLLCSIVCYTIL